MPNYIGRKSKYGPLKRGMVRDDGKVFWAYNLGNEIWMFPDTYEKASQNERRNSLVFAKRNPGLPAKRTKRWREDNQERYEAFKAEQRERMRRRSRGRLAASGIRKLLEAIEEPKMVSNNKISAKRFVRVFITPTECKYLASVLKEINPAVT